MLQTTLTCCALLCLIPAAASYVLSDNSLGRKSSNKELEPVSSTTRCNDRNPNCAIPASLMKPVVVRASQTSITFDMAKTLGNISDFDFISVAYRAEKSPEIEYSQYREPDGKYFTLNHLEANTEYFITFVMHERNWQKSPPNEFAGGVQVTARTCEPIRGPALQIAFSVFGAAEITISAKDDTHCQLEYLETDDGVYQKKIDLKSVQKWQKFELTRCKTNVKITVTLSDIYLNIVKAELICNSENHFSLIHPPFNFHLEFPCKPLDESFVKVTLEEKMTVDISPRDAEEMNICKPSFLQVTSNQHLMTILFKSHVDGFGLYEYDFVNCTFGHEYIISLFDEKNHIVKLRRTCPERRIEAFKKIVPAVAETRSRRIELDMAKILADFCKNEQIDVQYKEDLAEEWQTESYKPEMGKEHVIKLLKPDTAYAIRLVRHSKNETSVKGKEIQVHTKPCTPIDSNLVEMKFDAAFTAVGKPRVENEDLCRFKWMRVAADGLLLVNTRVFQPEIEWNLWSCRNGSTYNFAVKDERDNWMEINETCVLPQKTLEEADLFPFELPLTPALIVAAVSATVVAVLACACAICICCRRRRLQREAAEEQQRRRYDLSQFEVY